MLNTGAAELQWLDSGSSWVLQPKTRKEGARFLDSLQGHTILPLAVSYVVAGALSTWIWFTAHLYLCSTPCMTATLLSALSHSRTPQGVSKRWFQPNPHRQGWGTPCWRDSAGEGPPGSWLQCVSDLSRPVLPHWAPSNEYFNAHESVHRVTSTV